MRLDERRRRGAESQRGFEQLERKADVVREEYPDSEILWVLITHPSRPSLLQEAQYREIIVVQSFEWYRKSDLTLREIHILFCHPHI